MRPQVRLGREPGMPMVPPDSEPSRWYLQRMCLRQSGIFYLRGPLFLYALIDGHSVRMRRLQISWHDTTVFGRWERELDLG